MEAIKDNNELPIRKWWETPKKLKDDLFLDLDTNEENIPNWKILDIKEIADSNPWSNQAIKLKNKKIDNNWNKYIEINWRKYYEYNWESAPKDSMYIHKWNSLYIWDKFEWLAIRDWTIFKYTRWGWDFIFYEQRKAKYGWWTIHLKEIYKSEIFRNSEIITIISIWWKRIKITKNLIERYLKWELNQPKKNIVETAITIDPNVFSYIQSLKDN